MLQLKQMQIKICKITCPGSGGESKDGNSVLSVNRLAACRRVIPLLETAYCHKPHTVTASFLPSEAGYVRNQKYPQHKSFLFQHLTATVSNSFSHQAQGKPRSSQIHTCLMGKERLGRDFFCLISTVQCSLVDLMSIKINGTEVSFGQGQADVFYLKRLNEFYPKEI